MWKKRISLEIVSAMVQCFLDFFGVLCPLCVLLNRLIMIQLVFSITSKLYGIVYK